MTADWKDSLKSLLPDTPEASAPEVDATPAPPAETVDWSKVKVAMERKGRGGKTATILYGFTCSDEHLRQVASELKRTLGTGGSARAGEILIQGDCRDKINEWINRQKKR